MAADTALPAEYARDFQERTGLWPVGHMVMDYTDNTYGIVKAVTVEGEVALTIYNHIIEKMRE